MLKRAIVAAALVAIGIAVLVMTVPLGLEARSGTIQASNNTARSRVTSAVPGAKVATARIALINVSEHELMRKVVRLLRDEVGGLDFVEQVDLVQARDRDRWTIDPDARLDLYVVVSMPRCEISGFLPAGRTIDARIELAVGRQPWSPSHRVTDDLTPPLVDFEINSTLEHHSVTRGVETAAARYQLAAENVAAALARDLKKELAQLVSKHGLMGELPDVFFGRGDVGPPELPLPVGPALHQHYSGPRLLVHNETYWSLRTDAPRDWLRDLAENLEAGQWRIDQDVLDEVHASPYLRAKRGNGILVAFQQGSRSPGRESQGGDEWPLVVLRFQQRFSQTEARAAIETVMTEPLDFDKLAMLSRLMSQEQHERFFTAVECTGTADPALLMGLARYYKVTGQNERAMQALLRAAAIYWVAKQVPKNDVEKLGREITGEQRWQIPEPDESALQAAGYHHIHRGEPLEVEVGLNEPALFYREVDGRLDRHAAVVEHSAIPQGVLTLALLSPTGAARSTQHDPRRPWQSAISRGPKDGSVLVQASELAPDRFRLRVSPGIRTP